MNAVLAASRTVGIIEQPNDVTELISLFERIAAEEGWQCRDQLRVHAGKSTYFAVRINGKIVGGIQLERMAGVECQECSYQDVWPEMKAEPGSMHAYIAMLGIDRVYRGDRFLFWMPCISMWEYCREAGIQSLLLAATPTTLAAYRRLGWPLEIVGDLRLHFGEPCYLTSMKVECVEASIVAKAVRSHTYDAIKRYGYGEIAMIG